MTGPLTRWHDEHARFAQVLDVLDAELAAFRAGQEPDYPLMRDIVTSLHEFGYRFHHPREDVAFTRMADRDPGLRLIANRLLQEHRVMAWAGEELVNRFDQISEDAIVERASVEAAASTYLVYYRHHLCTEEREILPRAAELLTEEDWAEVELAGPAGPDSRPGRSYDACYESLRKQAASSRTTR